MGSAVSARSDLCEIAWNFYILFLAIDEVVAVVYVALVTARAFHHPVGICTPAVHSLEFTLARWTGYHNQPTGGYTAMSAYS